MTQAQKRSSSKISCSLKIDGGEKGPLAFPVSRKEIWNFVLHLAVLAWSSYCSFVKCFFETDFIEIQVAIQNFSQGDNI